MLRSAYSGTSAIWHLGPQPDCNSNGQYQQNHAASRQDTHAQAQYAYGFQEPFVLLGHGLDELGGGNELLLQLAHLRLEPFEALPSPLRHPGLGTLPDLRPEPACAARNARRRCDQVYPRYRAKNGYPARHRPPFDEEAEL